MNQAGKRAIAILVTAVFLCQQADAAGYCLSRGLDQKCAGSSHSALAPKSQRATLKGIASIAYLVRAVYKYYGFEGTGKFNFKKFDPVSASNFPDGLIDAICREITGVKVIAMVRSIKEVFLGKDGVLYIRYRVDEDREVLLNLVHKKEVDPAQIAENSPDIFGEYCLQVRDMGKSGRAMRNRLLGFDSGVIMRDELFGPERMAMTRSAEKSGPRWFHAKHLRGSLGHVFAGAIVLAALGFTTAYLFQLLPAGVMGPVLRGVVVLFSVDLLARFVYDVVGMRAWIEWCQRVLFGSAWQQLSPRDRVVCAARELCEEAKRSGDWETLEAFGAITGVAILPAAEKPDALDPKLALMEVTTGIMVLREIATAFKPLLKMILLHEARHRWQTQQWDLRYQMPVKLAYIKYLERDAWCASMKRVAILFYPVYVMYSAVLYFAAWFEQIRGLFWEVVSNGLEEVLSPAEFLPTWHNEAYRQAVLDERADVRRLGLSEGAENALLGARKKLKIIEGKMDLLRRHGITNVPGIALQGDYSTDGSLFFNVGKMEHIKETHMIVVYEGNLSMRQLDLMKELDLTGVDFIERDYFERVFSKYYDFFPQYLPLRGEKYLEEHLTWRLKNCGRMARVPRAIPVLARLLHGNLSLGTRWWGRPWTDIGKDIVERDVPPADWDRYVKYEAGERLSARMLNRWSEWMASSTGAMWFGRTFVVLTGGLIVCQWIALFSNPVLGFVLAHPWFFSGAAAAVLAMIFSIISERESPFADKWRGLITNYVDAGMGAAIARKLGKEEAGWEYVFLVSGGCDRASAYDRVVERFKKSTPLGRSALSDAYVCPPIILSAA